MDSVSGVGVIDKAVAVLHAIAERPVTLAELQQSADLPRATAHRLAVALERHGLVRRDADGRFALGLGLIGLGHAAAIAYPIAEASRPILAQLRDDTGESVQLFVREGDGRRAVVSLQSPHALRWIVPEGAVFPLDRGSAGKVLAGAAAPGVVVESIEEREPGVASASAAVVDRRGVMIAAISVSGPVERLTRAPAERFGDRLSSAARAIEALV